PGVAERPIARDCKSRGETLRRFESYPLDFVKQTPFMGVFVLRHFLVWIRKPDPERGGGAAENFRQEIYL
ncbi:MAG: hypothetical protein UT42_C0035G0001, partial [Candidatus Falkowbacteria bacterium GW2011_GWA2_39_24]